MRNSLLEVTPVIPGSLARLPELAANLFFSWHRPTRALFEDLDPELWKQTNGNPRLMIRCVNQSNLERCATDQEYVARYSVALETLDAYVQPGAPAGASPLVGYFCAEYGFHESFPIYSGGLGLLAGRSRKEAGAAGAGPRATPARRRATRAPTSSASGCCTSRAISRRWSTTTGCSTPSTASAIRATCRSSRCAPRRANG